MVIMRLHAIGHFEHWIIYLCYKWTNVFAMKVINEKCHLVSVRFVHFFFVVVFVSYLKMNDKNRNRNKKYLAQPPTLWGRKKRKWQKKKANAKTEVTIFMRCAIPSWHGMATCRALACASTPAITTIATDLAEGG